MGKIKIIFVNDSYHSGGAEKILQELVNHMPEDKYEITVQTPKEAKAFYKYYNKNINYYQAEPLSNKFYKKNNIFYKIIRKTLMPIERKIRIMQINYNYDIIVAFKEGPSLNYVSRTKIRKFAWLHINFDAQHWTKRYYKSSDEEYRIMSGFEKIVCVSESVKKGLERHVGKLANTVVLMNPLDENKIKQKADFSNQVSIFKKEKISFLCVGRLNFAKGYDRLVRIVEKLEKKTLDFEICIIGEGEEREKIEDLISKRKVTSIKLIGYCENPYPYMKKADWFLCCSKFEGFSTVLQEALVLGKAIITTDIGGARELLGDSEYGIVVENSEEALYCAMKSIIENSEKKEYYEMMTLERAKLINVEKSVSDILLLFERN